MMIGNMALTLTLLIVGMTCIISYQAFNNANIVNKLIMHPYTVKREGEFYRMLSSGFIHGGWGHLAINMYVMYIFGSYVESKFVESDYFGPMMGRILYIILYVGSIIAGAMPSYFKHQDNTRYRALGASGGTSGIILAFVIFRPWAELLLFFIIPCPAIIAAVLYLGYSSYASKNVNDNIGHDAHFWGAIFGFIFTGLIIYLLSPDRVSELIDNLMRLPF